VDSLDAELETAQDETGLTTTAFGPRTVEAFNPETNAWESIADLLEGRFSHGCCTMDDGTVVVAGGFNATGYLSSAELFDPETGTWTILPSMSFPREGCGCCALADGRALVAGGWGDDGLLAVCEIYDPLMEAWEEIAPMSTPRHSFGMCTVGDGYTVMVFGGWHEPAEIESTTSRLPADSAEQTTALREAEAYDSVLDSWSALPPMPMPRV
jgi:hypothetical protein